MAEKVRHNIDGLHFRAASAESLVDRLVEALRSPELWERLRSRIPRPISAIEAAEQHRALYDRLLEQRHRKPAEVPTRRSRRANGNDARSGLGGAP
jgi:hypothetical protein